MARIIRRETRKRGFFGWIFLLIFIGFNLFMAAVTLTYFGLLSDLGKTTASEAERAGHAIGSVIGVSMVLGMWASGALITGLFAMLFRGRKTIVEEYEA